MPFTDTLLYVALIAIVLGFMSPKHSELDKLGKYTFILFFYAGVVQLVILAFNFLTGN